MSRTSIAMAYRMRHRLSVVAATNAVGIAAATVAAIAVGVAEAAEAVADAGAAGAADQDAAVRAAAMVVMGAEGAEEDRLASGF